MSLFGFGFHPAAEMAKNGTKVSSSSSSVISHHHFFKIYLPAHSSHHLKIPASFASKFNGGLPEKAILKDHLGRLWHVEVAKVESDLVFQNDWEGFVNHHCLKLGDFLVFKYDGDLVFDVRILDNSECEKEDSKDYVYGDTIPRVVEEMISGNLETLDQPVCDSEHKDSEKCEKKMDKAESSDVKSDRGHALDAAGFVDPKNPHFTGSVKKHRPYELHVPKQLVIDHNLELKPEMIFRDSSGRSWPVKVIFRKDKRRQPRFTISKGWFAFWTQNRLEHGDECILEFNKGTDGTSNIINVYILPRQKLQQTAGK